MRYGSSRTNPVEPIALVLGQQVKLDEPELWRVRAVSDNFAALTRPISDRDRSEYLEAQEDEPGYPEELEDDGPFYTVLDWRNGVRGPCDLIGQSWGDGTYSESECAQMLAEFESEKLSISHRNWVPLRIGVVPPQGLAGDLEPHAFDPLRIGTDSKAYESQCLYSEDGGGTVCYRGPDDELHAGAEGKPS